MGGQKTKKKYGVKQTSLEGSRAVSLPEKCEHGREREKIRKVWTLRIQIRKYDIGKQKTHNQQKMIFNKRKKRIPTSC